MESIHYFCVLAKKVPAYCIKDGRRVLESLEGKGCELVDRTPAAGRAYPVPGVGFSSWQAGPPVCAHCSVSGNHGKGGHL